MSGWANEMDENWLQIRSYDGQGFQPLVVFAGWQMAILNYIDDIHPERIDKMERHTETDEVFVLIRGRGVLLIGGNTSQVGGCIRRQWKMAKSTMSGAIPGIRSC